jgi:hypothetical protein
MTTTQAEVRTRAEQVTLTLTFSSREYSIVSFAERFRGLQLLLTLVFLSDREAVTSPVPRFRLQRVSLSSPVEATIVIVFATASGAVVFGNRLIGLLRNASALRVDMAKDGVLKWKYDQMRKTLEQSVGENPEIDTAPAESALQDLESVAIVEAPPGVPELTIGMGPEVPSTERSSDELEDAAQELDDWIEEAKRDLQRRLRQIELMERRRRQDDS